jgi:hypothetical protein
MAAVILFLGDDIAQRDKIEAVAALSFIAEFGVGRPRGAGVR